MQLKKKIENFRTTENSSEGRWLMNNLPKVIISPKINVEEKMVIMRDSGVAMARNTGPFFSITHACK